MSKFIQRLENLANKKFIFFVVKFVIVIFTALFASLFLICFSFIITFSFIGTEIKSQQSLSFLKHIVNFKINKFDIDFSTIKIEKSPISNIQIKLQINDVKFIHKKTKMEVVYFENLNFSIPIKNIFNGNIIPTIQNIENKSFNIPIDTTKKLQRTPSKTNKISFTERVKLLSTYFANLTKISKYSLNKGIKINNLSFNFFDIKTKEFISKIVLSNSITKLVNKNDLNENYKSLTKALLTYNKQDNTTITNVKKLYNNIWLKHNGNKMFLVHTSKVKHDNGTFLLNGLCEYRNDKVDKCVFKLSNFRLETNELQKLLKNIKNFDFDFTLDGYLHTRFTKNGLEDIVLKADLNSNNKKIDIHNRLFDKITLELFANDNFENIFSSILKVANKNKVLSYLEMSDVVYKKGNFTNGIVKFQVNDIKLSDFYKTLSKDNILFTKINNFDGIIDGQLLFQIDKNGVLKQIDEDKTNIKLKNLIINSKTYNYNLSNLYFLLELIENGIGISIKSKLLEDNLLNDKNYFHILYDTNKNAIVLKFNDFTISKEYFEEIKKTLFTPTQLNIIKRFTYSFLINGNVIIPINKSFIKYGSYDLNLKIVSVDYDDHIDDNMFVKMNKKYGNEIGNIIVDFGQSIMYSALYDIHKKPEDKMYLEMTLDHKPSKEKNTDIQLDGKWFYNENKISNFYLYAGDIGKSLHIGIISPKSNLIVYSEKQYDYDIHIFGDRFYCDYDFWHTILLGITLLNSDGWLHLNIDNIKDGAIQDLKFTNFDLHFNVSNDYFMYGKLTYDNLKYNNRNYGKMYLDLQNNNSIIQTDNIVPLFTLIDNVNVNDIPMKKIGINANGQTDIQNKHINFNDFNVYFGYDGVGLFDFTRLNSFKTKNLDITQQDIKISEGFVDGDNIDACIDFDMNIKGATKLEGQFRVNSAFRVLHNIKKIFTSNKPLTTKSGGVSILKKGDTIDEFIKHMEINGKDFSADKNGNQEISLKLINNALSD